MKKEPVPYRVAVVGCGAIASLHAAYLTAMPQIRLAAFCDILPERADNLREQYAQEAHVYTDYVCMLVQEKPDAVHICTPHYLHCGMACTAMEAGCAVFLEKPMAISDEEIDLMLATERKTGAAVCVSFQNRCLPKTAKAYQLVQSHGGVKGAFCHVTWSRDEKYYTESGWRGQMRTEGGGVMINQACHTLDLCLGFCGRIQSISATTANHHLPGVNDVEDSCEAYMTFENGVTAVFYATTAHVRSAPIFMELVCRDGAVVQINGDRIYENDQAVLVPFDDTPLCGKVDWGVGHGRLIRRFYTSLSDNAPMPVSLSSAATAIRVLLAAYRSRGSAVTFDCPMAVPCISPDILIDQNKEDHNDEHDISPLRRQ